MRRAGMGLESSSSRIAVTWATIFPPPRGQVAKPGHGELAGEDDHDHPGRDEPHLDERQEGSRRQELVGQGVEEDPEPGHLVPPAREVPVQVVREHRQTEYRRPEVHVPLEPREEDDHEQRHEEDPQEGEGVRQVERAVLEGQRADL
jgi:hypothetical protein